MSHQSLQHVAALQAAFPFQGYIPETEHRAISLAQLKRIVAFVKCNCTTWADADNGRETILPLTLMNLYHVNEWLIRPATLARCCSFVELMTSKPQVPVWFVSHWWGEPVLRAQKS